LVANKQNDATDQQTPATNQQTQTTDKQTQDANQQMRATEATKKPFVTLYEQVSSTFNAFPLQRLDSYSPQPPKQCKTRAMPSRATTRQPSFFDKPRDDFGSNSDSEFDSDFEYDSPPGSPALSLSYESIISEDLNRYEPRCIYQLPIEPHGLTCTYI